MIKKRTLLIPITLILSLTISATIWHDYPNIFNNRETTNITGGIAWTFKTNDSIYSTPALSDIDGDGSLEVVFGSNDGNLYALNGENGSLLWKFSTRGPIYSSPAIGDLDNDGLLEVVFGSNDGNLYTLNGEDGSLLWKLSVPGYVDRSPSIVDLNGDGKYEIVFACNNYTPAQGEISVRYKVSNLYVVKGLNGEVIWFRKIPTTNTSKHPGGVSSPAVGDLNGDGFLDIAVYNTFDQIFTFNSINGSLLWSKYFITYQYIVIGHRFDSSPVLADINNDGKLEVIAYRYKIAIFNGNGELYSKSNGEIPNPQNNTHHYETDTHGSGTPALGDVNGDGKIDIIVIGSSGIYIYIPEKKIFKLIKLWNSTYPYTVVNSPSLADFTGDNIPEIIATDGRGYITIISGTNGNILWSTTINNTTKPYYIVTSPIVGDIDNDGDLDLIICDTNGTVYGFKLNNTGSKIHWQALRGTFKSERNLKFTHQKQTQKNTNTQKQHQTPTTTTKHKKLTPPNHTKTHKTTTTKKQKETHKAKTFKKQTK